jgi:chromosome segregation ATPase
VRLDAELGAAREQLERVEQQRTKLQQLLDAANAALATRAQEMRAHEQLLADTMLLRNVVESRLGQIAAGHAERDARIRSLEEARDALSDRNAALAKAAAAHEDAHTRAQQKIGSLEQRLGCLETQINATRESAAAEIEQVKSALLREQAERSTAEGALEAARKEVVRLMRELASLRQQRPAADRYSAAAPSTNRLPPAPRLQSVA